MCVCSFILLNHLHSSKKSSAHLPLVAFQIGHMQFQCLKWSFTCCLPGQAAVVMLWTCAPGSKVGSQAFSWFVLLPPSNCGTSRAGLYVLLSHNPRTEQCVLYPVLSHLSHLPYSPRHNRNHFSWLARWWPGKVQRGTRRAGGQGRDKS